jgi:hypothetical protein
MSALDTGIGLDTEILLRCQGMTSIEGGTSEWREFEGVTTLGDAIWAVFGCQREGIADEAYEAVVSRARAIVELLVAGEIESGELLGSGDTRIEISLPSEDDL